MTDVPIRRRRTLKRGFSKGNRIIKLVEGDRVAAVAVPGEIRAAGVEKTPSEGPDWPGGRVGLAEGEVYFISGVFVPDSEIPEGVLRVADAFPVRPFFQAFFTTWDPNTTGAGF